MKSVFVRFVREDAGQDLIEYGLLVGIITVAAIGAVKAIGPMSAMVPTVISPTRSPYSIKS